MQQQKLILVIDDFEPNRDLYAFILSEKGFRVAVASDGREGLDQALKLRPDLIIMDLSLPVISGSDLAARLKADESTRTIPIIVITAYDIPNSASEFGCEAILTKPCMPDRILSEVARILDRGAESGREESSQACTARPARG